MISLFGAGFIGKSFADKYKDEVFVERRGMEVPSLDDVLFSIGTSDNYNIFTNPTLDFDTNVNILIRLLNYCKDRQINITLLSSWFIYGGCKDSYINEESIGNPLGLYSISKLAQERVLMTYAKTFPNIKYKIIRLANIYGPGDKKVSAKKNALTYLINKLKKGEDVELYHNGRVMRNFLHIDDCVEGIKLIIDKGEDNSIYNLGASQSNTFRDIIKFAHNELKSKSQIKSIEPSPFHSAIQVKDFQFDTRKVQKLGFKSKITIQDGIRTIL